MTELSDGEIYSLASFGGDKAARDKFVQELLAAQAIEAGTAETGTGSVHESAVAASDAP